MTKLPATVIFSSLMLAASHTAMANDGAATYKLVCSSCHESGAVSAPKLEDKLQWKHRITQGMDALYASTINGKCKVFVKNLRKDLSDDTIKAAIDYMVSQARQPDPFKKD